MTQGWTAGGEINSLKSLSIKKFLNISSTDKIEIQGFRDASPQAYATVIYFENASDLDTVSLIAAKISVTPMKPILLPKL